MIIKTSKGYQVKSKDGKKNLSADNLSHEAAVKRLQQIEYFKMHKSEEEIHYILLKSETEKEILHELFNKLEKLDFFNNRYMGGNTWFKAKQLKYKEIEPELKIPLRGRMKINLIIKK